jgi:hypothetical protein
MYRVLKDEPCGKRTVGKTKMDIGKMSVGLKGIGIWAMEGRWCDSSKHLDSTIQGS